MEIDLLMMMLIIWGYHVFVAGVVAAPILYFGRKRVHWEKWELVAFVIPFAIWSIAILIDGEGKTLSNLGECQVISIAIPVAALIRVFVGQRAKQRILSMLLIVLLCAVGIATYFLMPGLPE